MANNLVYIDMAGQQSGIYWHGFFYSKWHMQSHPKFWHTLCRTTCVYMLQAHYLIC